MGCFYSIPNFYCVNDDLFQAKYFSINLKCVMPMLGQSKAEFEIHQPEVVLMTYDVIKNLSDMGVPVDPKNDVKYCHLVYNKTKNQQAAYVTKTNNEVVTSNFNKQYFELTMSSGMWITEILDIIESYPKATETTISGDDGNIGDSKFIYKKSEDLTYNFMKKDGFLTGIAMKRPDNFGLLAFLPAFVEANKVLNEMEITKIPKNLTWENIETQNK